MPKKKIIKREPEDGIIELSVEEMAENATTKAMNDLALRIWEGQSPDLPKKIRVERIAMRLRDRGYEDLKALDLPAEDYKRYL